MTVALQWFWLDPNVKVRPRLAADSNSRAIVVQPKVNFDVQALAVRTLTHWNRRLADVISGHGTVTVLLPESPSRIGHVNKAQQHSRIRKTR
jgi:hypothetical protein